jgi:hypothetical protein
MLHKNEKLLLHDNDENLQRCVVISRYRKSLFFVNINQRLNFFNLNFIIIQ